MISVMALYNTLLKKSFSENIPLSHIKLQRLIYLIYVEYAKQTGNQLFSEDFQAWPKGPVLRSVYDKFACMQERITCFGRDAKGNVMVIAKAPNLINKIIDSVWDYYKFCSGPQLANLVIQPGSPWYNVYRSKRIIITFEDIERTLL